MKMNNKKLKTTSLLTLIGGYILAAAFILMMILNVKKPEVVIDEVVQAPEEVVIEHNTTIIKEQIVYENRRDLPKVGYVDHLDGVIVDDRGEIVTAVVRDDGIIGHGSINNINDTFIPGRDINRYNDRGGIVESGIRSGHVTGGRGSINHRNRGDRVDVVDDATITYDDAIRRDNIIDPGLLDRRIRDLDREDKIGLDTKDGIALDRLTPVSNGDNSELGEIDTFDDVSTDGGYGVGKGGQLYAYNFPSRGVGAGVGSSGLGAGNGAGAGLGAGIGEGVLNGESVPTLGGVGTYSMPGAEADAGPGEGSGVGGLIGGAGAGGAAGLYTGRVTDMLGVGGPGTGGPGAGGYGRGNGRANYDHLPKDGALHIMMHVDGSGSILNTRKQLDIMKDTVLKTALLPYYNNDETLYNRRVTIVDGSGERTLRFFTEAAKKDNVLAVVFQDEAQPAYHLPNFNKKPEDHYMDDLGKLKASLNGYGGVYRGVMFQVDRGKTFAKSFKEFVGNAFNGEGYLKSDNLKKYHRDSNTNHIKNRNGIIFSDEYHAKDSGDPQYYLDLIFNASKRVGLDLDIYGAGLTDGKYNKKTN